MRPGLRGAEQFDEELVMSGAGKPGKRAGEKMTELVRPVPCGVRRNFNRERPDPCVSTGTAMLSVEERSERRGDSGSGPHESG